MASRKLTALPTATEVTTSDKIYIVDVSDTTESPQGTSKQAVISELPSSGITSLTSTDGSIDIDNTDPSAPDLSIPSGTWTPVASDVTNDATVTLLGGIYSRAGNIVTAGFNWEVQLDAAQLDTTFTVNLPIPSTFTAATDLNAAITGTFDNGIQTISDFSIRAGDGVLEVSNFAALINGGTFSGSMVFIYIVR